MSNDTETRLEAVRTAIDAVIAKAADGEFCLSYSIGDRRWAGSDFADLLKTLRDEEKMLMARLDDESRTGGTVVFASMRNEPQ